MKKCEFCGKQISYFDQYCDDECHIKANKFYEKGERFGKLFAVINMISKFKIRKAVKITRMIGGAVIFLGVLILLLALLIKF